MCSSNEALSDTDPEDEFNEDMEALRRAFQITGTSPPDRHFQTPAVTGIVEDGEHLSGFESDLHDDDDDDLALVRSIQQRFAISTDVNEPLTLKPLCSMLPDWSDTDDCADDLETLRAIQRRFAAYDDDLKDVDDSLQKTMKVGANVIDTEKETSSSLFVERTNAAEGYLTCVDKSGGSGLKLHDDADGTQLSDFFEWIEHGTDDMSELPGISSKFPKSAQTLFGAIKKNRSCQQLIERQMFHMGTRIENLNKLMHDVKIVKDFQVSCKRKTGRALSIKRDDRMQLISVPKQRANGKINENHVPAMYKGPPENPHVAHYNEALAAFPVTVSQVKWSKEEKENLLKGLKQQFQNMLLQRSLSDADGSSAGSNDVDSIISSIKDLDITPEKLRLFLPKVDWEQLAAMYVPGRNGAACQAWFLNCEDALINHTRWDPSEDKNLLHVVQQKGLHNWIDIAASLGTNRTPFQCLARYQRSLNASILKREWTKEEDNQLRAAVETYGESNWQVVASVVGGRTGTQCSNRWLKTLHPARKMVGKWTLEENKRLKVAVTLFGPKTWKKIADYVPGRTQVQCRERWVNCLDPSLNIAKWTEEEDSKLEAAIAEHGYRWNKVAACIPCRTDNQCLRRWKIMFPHELRLLRAARKIQKTALISNFVDRESERPALGPNDFVLPDTYRITGSENVDPSRIKKRRSRRKKEKKHIEKDSPPRLRNGSGVQNILTRSIRRKTSKNSDAAKTMAGLDEEIRRSSGNSKRRPWLKKKRSQVRAEPVDATLNGKKTSKLQPRRKIVKPTAEVPETAYEVEMRVWDETFSKMNEAESSLPDSVNANKANEKSKIQETCSNSESENDSAISPENNNVSLRGNCSQHSVMGSGNHFSGHSFFESIQRSNESDAGEASEIEDNMTLACFLSMAKRNKCEVQSRFSASDVLITYTRGKRKVEAGGSRNGNDACPSEVVEVEPGDDATLAANCRKLKRRRKER